MKKNKGDVETARWADAQTRKDYVEALIATRFTNAHFRVKDLYGLAGEVGIGRSYVRTLVRILEKQDLLVRLSYGHYATMDCWKAQEQGSLPPSEGAA